MQAGYVPPSFLNGDYKLDSWGYNLGLLNSIGQKFYSIYSAGYVTDGPQSYNSIYSDKEIIDAGYAMGEFNVGPKLTVVPGVRYEEIMGTYGAYIVYTNNSNSNGLAGQAPIWRAISTTNVDFFPSVNIKYKANENIQFSGAYYSSAARPNFSDLSPVLDYPNVGTATFAATSNPYLKPAVATNFDLGASLFSNTLGLFSVNVFYKEIKDLSYSMAGYEPYYARTDIVNAPSDMLQRLPPIAYFDTSWLAKNGKAISTSIAINNPNKAYVRGIELSWQTHLWYLPGVLSGIVLDLNVSLMNSNTIYPYFDNHTVAKDTLHRASGNIIEYYQLAYLTRSGTLVNMPKATYNAILGWDYKGFSLRVSARYQQTTLTSLDSKYSIADAYYDNVVLVDIMLKQKIITNLSVFANFTNIGSHVDSYYYTPPSGVQLPTSQQTYGFNAQFGVGYNF
jgi:TonB-dependent receptor